MVRHRATSGPGRSLDKGRLEAFSDGVLAIAVTLLVLEIAVHPPGSPLTQFLNAWPSYLGYVVSFLTIGAAWIGHDALTDGLERVDVVLLRLNLLFLMVVSFLPFPTRLVADSLGAHGEGARVAAVVYGLTLLGIRLLNYLLDAYARRAGLIAPGPEGQELERSERKFGVVVAAYVATIGISLVVPVAGIILYFTIALVIVVPYREVVAALKSVPADGT